MVEKPPKLWACQGLEVTIQAFKVFGAGAGTPAWTAPAVPRPSGLTQNEMGWVLQDCAFPRQVKRGAVL